MTGLDGTASDRTIPLELTAPTIQRLVRKGLTQPLTRDEQSRLCECLAFHIDVQLDKCRIPRALGSAAESAVRMAPGRRASSDCDGAS